MLWKLSAKNGESAYCGRVPVNQDPNERGATMTEYALVAVLMVMAILAVVAFMTQGVSTSFSRAGSAFR